MRLWHQSLIHYLPRQQLLGQYRECCALRGNGWGRNHSIVNYVFSYDMSHLFQYHVLVMHEMAMRKYKPDMAWYSRTYRGKKCKRATLLEVGTFVRKCDEIIYSEHDNEYLKECLLNLQAKGAELVNGESISHMLFMLAVKYGI